MSEKIEKWIDEALRAEPAFHLGADFKDKVVKAIRKREQANTRNLYFLMVLGIIVICAIAFGTISFFMPDALAYLKSIRSVVPFAVILGSLIAIIQYLDKKLVRDRILLSKH